jgi:hypothetical protein
MILSAQPVLPHFWTGKQKVQEQDANGGEGNSGRRVGHDWPFPEQAAGER